MCKCNKKDRIFQMPRIGSEDQFEENRKVASVQNACSCLICTVHIQIECF